MNARFLIAAGVLGALGILAGGCSWWYDAQVVNPCPHPIRIEMYNDPPERVRDRPPRLSLYLPARSTTLVEGAFTDPDGHWSLRVVGISDPFAVEEDRLEDETVELSEEVCAKAWRPDGQP